MHGACLLHNHAEEISIPVTLLNEERKERRK